MRVIACVSVLVALGSVACGSGEEGARGGNGGSGGSGVAGSSVVPMGGSTNPTAGASSVAGTGVTTGGTGVTTGGTSSVAGSTATGGTGGTGPVGDGKAHVITWVPSYHIDESKQQLTASFDGMGMADGLSYLGLQFWLTDGPSARLHQVGEGDVTWFTDWAHQHGVKVLLCVHNNTGDWNWPEAVRAFKDNREAFAADLVSQVQSRNLDGVDLDLEGIIEPTADDQESYRQFVQVLSSALRPLGKTLTLDSFHGQWNAPNWNWWADLFPLVDGITSMGYEQSGMGVDYEDLVYHAEVAQGTRKLMIGVPSYQGTWLGHGVMEQLGWLNTQGKVGTAIWDASLMAAEWRQRGVWDTLKTIKSR